jgi:hypothetical protein
VIRRNARTSRAPCFGSLICERPVSISEDAANVRLGCMPLAQGAEARAPQITGRLLQVLAFKCLSVYQLTILPFNYLYSAVLAAL